jgi:hypothetical protein
MANYIYPAPGVTGVEATLRLEVFADATDDSLLVPSLQDITVNAANDVFTWTQLDEGSKKQVATTATNSLSMNLVLNQTSFFGDGTSAAGTASLKGIFGMSSDKDLVEFTLYLGDDSEGNPGKIISGTGYVTGLAPTVSADSPVWVSPITITVTGDYLVTTAVA